MQVRKAYTFSNHRGKITKQNRNTQHFNTFFLPTLIERAQRAIFVERAQRAIFVERAQRAIFVERAQRALERGASAPRSAPQAPIYLFEELLLNGATRYIGAYALYIGAYALYIGAYALYRRLRAISAPARYISALMRRPGG